MALSLTLPSSNLKLSVVLQRTARICSKVRAARAARLFFLIGTIEFLICDVVVAVGTKASLLRELIYKEVQLRKQRVRQYFIFPTEINLIACRFNFPSENASVALLFDLKSLAVAWIIL